MFFFSLLLDKLNHDLQQRVSDWTETCHAPPHGHGARGPESCSTKSFFTGDSMSSSRLSAATYVFVLQDQQACAELPMSGVFLIRGRVRRRPLWPAESCPAFSSDFVGVETRECLCSGSKYQSTSHLKEEKSPRSQKRDRIIYRSV